MLLCVCVWFTRQQDSQLQQHLPDTHSSSPTAHVHTLLTQPLHQLHAHIASPVKIHMLSAHRVMGHRHTHFFPRAQGLSFLYNQYPLINHLFSLSLFLWNTVYFSSAFPQDKLLVYVCGCECMTLMSIYLYSSPDVHMFFSCICMYCMCSVLHWESMYSQPIVYPALKCLCHIFAPLTTTTWLANQDRAQQWLESRYTGFTGSIDAALRKDRQTKAERDKFTVWFWPGVSCL